MTVQSGLLFASDMSKSKSNIVLVLECPAGTDF